MVQAFVTITEDSFNRLALAAPLPVVVLFGAPGCPATAAFRQPLQELATRYAGRLRVATVNAMRHAPLAEQLLVEALPSLLVAQGGEIRTRATGFLPRALLDLFCQQVADGSLPRDLYWSPVEETFEELVVAPLLESWGLRFVRQAACPAPVRGRVDFLVYHGHDEQPLTLIENKRHIYSAHALVLAVQQAYSYAQALQLRSFVVAAPAGLWIYTCSGKEPLLVRRVSALELQQEPAAVGQWLRLLGQW